MRHLLTALLTLFCFITATQATEPSHGLSMFGDLKYPANFKHFDYVNPDAPKGGTLTLAAMGSFDSLNSYILKGVPALGGSRVHETLLTKSLDEPFSEYGLLAESVWVADDRLSVSFRLRPEARWHDGTPVTVDDVIFSFNTLKEKGHPFYRSYYRDVTSVEKTGDRTVTFHFSTADNRELPLILGQMPVLPSTYYATHPFDESSLEPPLGSGPYKVATVDPGRSITYERVADYWGKDLPANRGRHNFDRIRYDYYRDEGVMVEALKAGEYDLRQENISRIWATAYNTPAVKEGRLIRKEIMHEIPSGMQGFVMNIRRAPLNDPAFREALNWAFDFEWTNKTLFYSAYQRTTSYFSNSPFAATGLPSEAELALLEPFRDQLPARVFTEAPTIPKTDGSGNNRANLLKAKQLLDAAGYRVVNNQLLQPGTDTPVSIEFLLGSSAFERVVAPLVRSLKRLGIEGKIRVVDSAQYQRRLDDFDYDIIVHTYGQSMSPGNEQIDYWHSSRADMKGSSNYIGLKNPAVDALVEKIVSASSYEELQTACRALDRVLLWEFYVVPNWYNQSFRMIYWNKFGQPDTAPKYDLGLETWWIDPEKLRALGGTQSSTDH